MLLILFSPRAGRLFKLGSEVRRHRERETTPPYAADGRPTGVTQPFRPLADWWHSLRNIPPGSRRVNAP